MLAEVFLYPRWVLFSCLIAFLLSCNSSSEQESLTSGEALQKYVGEWLQECVSAENTSYRKNVVIEDGGQFSRNVWVYQTDDCSDGPSKGNESLIGEILLRNVIEIDEIKGFNLNVNIEELGTSYNIISNIKNFGGKEGFYMGVEVDADGFPLDLFDKDNRPNEFSEWKFIKRIY